MTTQETNRSSRGQILAIEDAAALLAAIVASSSDAILSKTLDGTITSWNDATARLFGYTASEMIGTSIRRLIPPDRHAEENRILAAIAAGERLDNYETVRLRKDGSPIDVSVTISPVRDQAGTIIGASKIIRDITEKKKSERQIRDLLEEVNYRSRNMLALAQAIARQTVNTNPQDFLDRFNERLRALSASQDLLVKNQWRGVGMEELVRAQLRPHQAKVGTRIRFHGPELVLKPAAAQNLGLVLHELGTNAAKFGALSNAAGEIEIVWAADENEFSIEWHERGGPEVGPPGRGGYGSSVIASIAGADIGGHSDVTYASTGLVWKFQCPAAKVIAASEIVS